MSPTPLEPSRFDAERASPEMRAAVEWIERNTRAMERGAARSEETAREARRRFEEEGAFAPGPPSERAEERSLPGPAAPIPVRIFRPKGPVRGALLHFHGGGWVVGRAAMNDLVNERRADELGVVVMSVDYRLAPEHPHPAAPDDCEAAAVWLALHAKSELDADPSRIFVGGESAGAHLAAVTTLRLLHRHGFRFRAASLVYGVYDLGGVPSHRAFDDRNVILNSTSIGWFTECYVPDPARRRDPDVSPLYDDLRGAPPALFTVGSLDPLLDHTLFMHARWLAAGSPAEIQVFPGAPHGFDFFPTPESRQAHQTILSFLRNHL